VICRQANQPAGQAPTRMFPIGLPQLLPIKLPMPNKRLRLTLVTLASRTMHRAAKLCPNFPSGLPAPEPAGFCVRVEGVPPEPAAIYSVAENSKELPWEQVQVLTVDYNSPEDPYLNAAEAELRSLPIAGEPRPEPVPVTLEACTEHFTAPEEIDDYKCEGCKTVCCQSMRVSLCRLPPVLVIHLKRFKFTEYGSTKINVPVEIPLQLRGSQLQGSQCEWVRDAGAFSLYAVVHHLGSCGGGHYVASVRHRQSGKWYECDDSHCTEVLPEDVQAEASKCGYVLFYAQDETLRCEAGEDAVWEVSVNRLWER